MGKSEPGHSIQGETQVLNAKPVRRRNNMQLTTDVDLPVWQWQQGRVQWVLGVSEDGVPPIGLLHCLQVQAVLLGDVVKEQDQQQ